MAMLKQPSPTTSAVNSPVVPVYPAVNMSKPSLARDLIITANEAFKLYPGNCSGAVYWVIVNLVDPMMPQLLANQMMSYFANPSNGWKRVENAAKASALANQGIVVVGGLAEAAGHGHVIIVLPGPWKQSGGYSAISGSGASITVKKGNYYPPSMSTAWSKPGTKPWAGAVSNGDKTVYDPWDNLQLFSQVTFWTKNK